MVSCGELAKGVEVQILERYVHLEPHKLVCAPMVKVEVNPVWLPGKAGLHASVQEPNHLLQTVGRQHPRRVLHTMNVLRVRFVSKIFAKLHRTILDVAVV